MKIKICGITTEKEIKMLNEAKVDYAGFVFYEKSKRYILPEKACEIAKGLDPGIRKVAVTVSADAKTAKKIEELGFDIIQIHGELKEEVLRSVNIPVWRALNVKDMDESQEKTELLDHLPLDLGQKIEAFVVDAPSFGSGHPFNWAKSKRLKKAGTTSPPQKRMFVLAGGLNSENVSEGIKLFKPDIVDVSSSVEGQKGKDEKKVKEFVNEVRRCTGR
ncbi:MAG: phosphoribosylanthranilate isomerase [Lachnospiraceae bacterium]|nr:phosphoribosylanthranilate isomerase [Lachnospiraceae bacterium]